MRYEEQISDMTWSYSRLTGFESCPYKWFLTYVYRDEFGRMLEKRSSFFAEFGTLMHSCMEHYLKGEIPKDKLPDYYQDQFPEVVLDAAPTDSMLEKYYNQGLEYCRDFSFPERKILGIEERITFDFGGYKWRGIIDVVSEDENGALCITDHKSHMLRPRSGRAKPTKYDEELDEYLRQLYIYAAAYQQKTGIYPEWLEFNCFRSGYFIREPFSLERLHEVEEWAERTVKEIAENSDWKPVPDYWQCHYLCDVCRWCKFKTCKPEDVVDVSSADEMDIYRGVSYLQEIGRAAM